MSLKWVSPNLHLALAARQRIRSRHGIAEDAVVFTAFGKVTPEKRVREAMRALASVMESAPHAHLLVAGEAVDYYDLQAEAESARSERASDVRRIPGRRGNRRLPRSVGRLSVHAVADIARDVGVVAAMSGGGEADNLDRPGSYGRRSHAGSAGLVGVGWPGRLRTSEAKPVGVSIDILDEGHSLKLAIRRLATDEKLRATLGSNARALWSERFRLEGMVAGYQRVIARLLQAAASAMPTASKRSRFTCEPVAQNTPSRS